VNVKELYPAQKRRRYQWSTRKSTHDRRVKRTVFAQKEREQPYGRTEIWNRPLGIFDLRQMRRDFYRFNTKPNWAAHVAALKGAHLAMIEAERG
jgi:hypothetical protein